MMIKLLTPMAGVNFSRRAGEIVDRPDDEARRLIERGMAEPVRSREPEATVKRGAEMAVTRGRKPK